METTYITNIFKHSDIKIAYRTNNSLPNQLTNHTHTHKDQYSSSVIYKHKVRQEETSLYDTMNTNMPSATITPLLTLPNTLTNTQTHLALSTQSCISYIKKKDNT
jgi:hypothetical protein